ncbi:MAG: TetR family transcriptional regulator [Arthrobacter sp.]
MEKGVLRTGHTNAEDRNTAGSDQAGFRSVVAETAVRLYAARGFEATTVEDIARAAEISRSTFFRHFRSKEDVVFADHDELVEQAETFLAGGHENPWRSVCEAAALVFRHYSRQGVIAKQRYLVVNAVPALRDKELVTVFRYEHLFNQYLRRALPGMAPLDGIRFTGPSGGPPVPGRPPTRRPMRLESTECLRPRCPTRPQLQAMKGRRSPSKGDQKR